MPLFAAMDRLDNRGNDIKCISGFLSRITGKIVRNRISIESLEQNLQHKRFDSSLKMDFFERSILSSIMNIEEQ